MSDNSPAIHISTPIQHELIVDSRYVSHVRALLSHVPTPGFYRTDGEAMMARQTEILHILPGQGGDGPGPEQTSIIVLAKGSTTLFYLAYYWGRRELRLQQRDGMLDNIGQAMQRDPLSVNPY